MSLLVVSASTACSAQVNDTISALTNSVGEYQVLDLAAMHIEPCRGCYVCMLKTPGRCCIRDDTPELIRAWVQSDIIILIVDTALNFVDAKGKNVIDRLFLLANINLCYRDGEILHIPRYKRSPQLTLLYTGHADPNSMNIWIDRVAKHLHATSLGAMPITNASEVGQWIL